MPHVPIGGIPMMPHGNHVTYVFYLFYCYVFIYLPRGVSRLLCMRRKKSKMAAVGVCLLSLNLIFAEYHRGYPNDASRTHRGYPNDASR